MLWLKACHIIAMVAWFAGLFYLPRLFVYHADAVDEISLQRFKTMERRLFWCIMTPAAVVTLVLGLALLPYLGSTVWQQGWLHAKLGLVFLLVLYHIACGVYLRRFCSNSNRHSSRFYRFMNEVPGLLLVAVVCLVVVKPF